MNFKSLAQCLVYNGSVFVQKNNSCLEYLVDFNWI